MLVGIIGSPCIELFSRNARDDAHEEQHIWSERVHKAVLYEELLECSAQGVYSSIVGRCLPEDLECGAERDVIIQDADQGFLFRFGQYRFHGESVSNEQRNARVLGLYAIYRPCYAAHMKKNIIRVGERERKYVEEVLASQFSVSRKLNMIGRFERAFADKFGSKYAIAHTNGTATLHTALFAAGVRAGDEVITTPLTMSATAMAILHADAVPVFADVNEETFQIDPASIEKLITPRTKAIMTVALYGLSPDMDPIMELAKKHGIMVIEDDAQCFLSTYKGRMVGTIGHLSSFSFQSQKHLSSGEGGVVLTDDEQLADTMRKFFLLGYSVVNAKSGQITKDVIQNPDFDRHVSMGYNYRMSELAAAAALGQTEHMEELIERRVEVGELFKEAVGDCAWLIPQVTPTGYTNSYWAFAARLTHPSISWTTFRTRFMELGGDGIYAAWKLSYLEPMFQTMDLSGKERVIEATYTGELQAWAPGLCPVAEKVQKQILAFKTNYWDWERALAQADVLKRTIASFES